MKKHLVSILDGNTFVVSHSNGDIDASPTDISGLFYMDTRFLSRWVLRLNGERLNSLSTDDLRYFSAQFFLVPKSDGSYVDSPLSIVRKRAVGLGFHEDLIVMNHGQQPLNLEIRMEAGADFADLFEIKSRLQKKGQHYSKLEDKKLVLGYKREEFIRETWITSKVEGEIDEQGISFKLNLLPQQEWSTEFDIITEQGGSHFIVQHPKYQSATDRPKPDMGMDMEEWISRAPKLNCSWQPLKEIYRRSMVDLAALRFFSSIFPTSALPAAGLPWFMAVFGRDSIITSFQALPFQPELAATTLQLLGAKQGQVMDDFRDEEPGKIFHESRLGELTAFSERPHSPYYGTADATPLYLILLDEYHRFTGDSSLVLKLKEQAYLALEWIDKYGDKDGDGYVEYESRNKQTGLENQCWKDSNDSIRFSDGRMASLPRATCEIQGYVYDAKVRCARLARLVWQDEDLAERLEAEAAELKKKFNRDFWLEDRQFFALALDGSKQKVDALTSNIGHLLWSGIVDNDKAQACVAHLMGENLYSGWGIRTMAMGEGGYNPIGYHVGTVWPHDNSIIALGLRRYGFVEEAARIAMGIFEAATFFDYRLPEAFAGYARNQTWFPVEYPTACSPQAWSTGAPLLLLRAILGLEPIGNKLLVDPAIPDEIRSLEILDIPGCWGSTDAFGRGLISLKKWK